VESRLIISQVAERSVVTALRSHAPLKLLTPRNHGHAAWVFQSSLGGGFVGGDEVRLDVEVEPGATLFLSSQASSKVYRGARSRFTLEAKVAAGATLCCWPDPVVCFEGASLLQRQSFALRPEASLLWVDAWTAGRSANGERWRCARFESDSRISLGGEPRFRDAWLLSADHGELRARLEPLDAFATVVLAGPKLSAARAACEAAAEGELPRLEQAAWLSASRWEWGTVLRVGAPAAGVLASTLRTLLQPHVAALLGDDPCARKW